MAQDGSLKLPLASTSAACEALHCQPAKLDILPTTAVIQSKDRDGQHPEDLSRLKSGSEVGDDDEVRFVFSAPRRRKRKRKKYGISSFEELY
jgi:hypothetical protein